MPNFIKVSLSKPRNRERKVTDMRYRVITIEREYASGGREIGEQLAQKLGIPCYGQEVLEKAAANINLPVKDLHALEERMTGTLLYSMSLFADMISGKNIELTIEQKLAIAESEIIKELSATPCVIIGRSSAGLFKEQKNVLKAFVYADVEQRIKRAVEIYEVDPKQAEAVLRRCDKRRMNYFKSITGAGWKNPEIYHLMLNSGKLGISGTVDMLYGAVK